MVNTSNHIFAGLQQDTAISRQQPQYLIDAHNIRITAREGETLLTVTNERGPKECYLIRYDEDIEDFVPYTIYGTILGHCVLNKYLVLFIRDEEYVSDSIVRIDMSQDTPIAKVLFNGSGENSLNFNLDYPIETLGDYENESIQKVYWTDNLNQPRVITINKDKYTWNGAFDFVPELQLKENVTVKRESSTNGRFAAGVIQYAFTYYNKFGQESNIFHTTPLLYVSYNDRAGAPDDVIGNAFKITITNLDSHFEYLRIYSIQRTSLNGTPICKKVQDIPLVSHSEVTFVDTGTTGEDVEPTSLLYKGGEDITAGTLAAKDGTLFLGNIKINRTDPREDKEFLSVLDSREADGTTANYTVNSSTKYIRLASNNSAPKYEYYSGLGNNTAGFKSNDYYRLGFQAQYKNGKWSEPYWLGDHKMVNSPDFFKDNRFFWFCKPYFTANIAPAIVNKLIELGYKRIRPVVVFPDIQDRDVLCQGILAPTLSTTNNVDNGIVSQSSWFFRSWRIRSANNTYAPLGNGVLFTMEANTTFNPSNIRMCEIQGAYNKKDRFNINWNVCTLHSPDLELDHSLWSLDFSGIEGYLVGNGLYSSFFSDIDIQTKSATISNGGSGFKHEIIANNKSFLTGLFYDDYAVDDDTNKFAPHPKEKSPYKWFVYPWHKTGSLNNDITRPENSGTRSAELKKKVMAYHRVLARESTSSYTRAIPISYQTLFQDGANLMEKLGDNIYMGNVDTVLTPEKADGLYFAFDNEDWKAENVETSFYSNNIWKSWSNSATNSEGQGLYKWNKNTNAWVRKEGDFGDKYPALALQKDFIRMRYKSTTHLVLQFPNINHLGSNVDIPVLEIRRSGNNPNRFGGTSQDAFMSNVWLPAGNSVLLHEGNIILDFEYGDTWYNRYDFLKTYPFSRDDENQIVEIASIPIESRINLDGRYDRNRGQVSNINMSPTNFNLFNPVYNQKDNFFSYRILDSSFYELNSYPNQITWSTEKSSGMDIDPWTSVSLAATYDMDGSKGQIRALKVWSDNIYCFQDEGVCNVLFNSRVQIPTSDGVPIEISNNYKVDGKRYILDGVGCLNKYAICATPAAIYFIDSISGHLQTIGGNLSDLSANKSMTTWFQELPNKMWTPNDYSVRLFYDNANKDVYTVTKNESLCFSEMLGEFTSFMSYEDIPVMFNNLDKFYCIKGSNLYKMFDGEYNRFFGTTKGYDITFICNGVGQSDNSSIDKIFNTIDFRADRWSHSLGNSLSKEPPFDYIRVWNEYQDTGEVKLKNKLKPSNLKQKFRVWRLQIPRDANNRIDRIRNMWSKITLGSAPRYNNHNDFIQLHDVVVNYFM